MIRVKERNGSVVELNQMQRYIGEEMIDEYQAGHLSRRVMLRRLIYICGSATTAAALLTACGATATITAVPTTAAPTVAPTTAPATTAPVATTAAPASVAPTTAAATTAPAATTASSAATTAPAGSPAAQPPAPTPAPAKGPLTVPATDPDVEGAEVTYQSDTPITAYLAKPKAAGTYPGVIVIHENRGLNDHIKDVARRLAKAGFIALAPDLVSRAGGSTTNTFDKIPGLLTAAKPEDLTKDLSAGVAYLEKTTGIKADKFGVVGFCFGGAYTLRLAAANPKIAAAVPYYGVTPDPADIMASTNAAILGNYGATDTRVNGTIPALEKVMADNKKTYEKKLFEGAGHAFNNDTGASYNEKAAVDAWKGTLDWFTKYLK